MKRNLVTLVLAIVVIVSLVIGGCAKPAPEARVLKFPIHEPEGSFNNKEDWAWFANRVNELANGELEVVMYYSESLCAGVDQYEAIRDGIADLGVFIFGYEGGLVKYPGILEFLFAYKDEETHQRTWAAWMEAGMSDYLDQFDVKILPKVWVPAPQNLITNKSVLTLEDLQGHKIRIPGPAAAKCLVALGAVPVSVTGAEIYLAMQKGVVDAVSIPNSAMIDLHLDELGEYVIVLEWMCGGMPFCVNMDVWNSLTPGQQAIMNQASREAHENNAKKSAAAGAEALQKMEAAGITIVRPSPTELARWKEILIPTWDSIAAEMGPDGPKYLQIMKDISGGG